MDVCVSVKFVYPFNRHKALEAEKKRAKDIACLPPPPKDLISVSASTKQLHICSYKCVCTLNM